MLKVGLCVVSTCTFLLVIILCCKYEITTVIENNISILFILLTIFFLGNFSNKKKSKIIPVDSRNQAGTLNVGANI